MNLKLRDKLFHPYDRGVLEFDIIGIYTGEPHNYYRVKTPYIVGDPSGKRGKIVTNVVAVGDSITYREPDIGIDADDVDAEDRYDDVSLITGYYYTTREEAELVFYNNQLQLAKANMDERKRQYEDAVERVSKERQKVKDIEEALESSESSTNKSEVKVGDMFYHLCSVDILEFTVERVHLIDPIPYYTLRATYPIGACGKVRILASGPDVRLQFTKLLNEEFLDYGCTLSNEWLVGRYYPTLLEARYIAHTGQYHMACQVSSEKESLYKEAKARYEQVQSLTCIHIQALEGSSNACSA